MVYNQTCRALVATLDRGLALLKEDGMEAKNGMDAARGLFEPAQMHFRGLKEGGNRGKTWVEGSGPQFNPGSKLKDRVT